MENSNAAFLEFAATVRRVLRAPIPKGLIAELDEASSFLPEVIANVLESRIYYKGDEGAAPAAIAEETERKAPAEAAEADLRRPLPLAESLPRSDGETQEEEEENQGDVSVVRGVRTPLEVRSAGGENSPELYVGVHDEFGRYCVLDPGNARQECEAYTLPVCDADLRDTEDLRSGARVREMAEVASSAGEEVEVKIRMDLLKQRMVGFGFSHAFCTRSVAEHPNKVEIFDLLLRVMQPSIVRLRNVYEHGEESKILMETDGQFMSEAARILGDDAPHVMLCAWTPPRRLKESGRLNGGKGGVLKKDKRGWFTYSAWADWWVESYRAYEGLGIKAVWISQQNEPNYSTDQHQSCAFDAVESF